MAFQPPWKLEAIVQSSKSLIADYNLGDWVALTPLSHQGYANYNLKFETTRGTFLYRICMDVPLEKVQHEVEVLEYLKKEGIPLAAPLKRIDGHFINSTTEGNVVLYEFINGSEPPLSPKVAEQLGKHLAQLHLVPVPATLDRENSISIDKSENLAELLFRTGFSPPLLASLFSEEIDRVASSVKEPLPQGWVHTDVVPDNTLYEGERFVAFIDFEMICQDHLLLDLAVAVQGFCFDEGRVSEDRLLALIDGYQSVRRLTEKELEVWEDYVCFGGLFLAHWHLEQLLERSNEKQLHRAHELISRSVMISKSGLPKINSSQ